MAQSSQSSYHTFLDYASGPGVPGIIVPQTIYRNPSNPRFSPSQGIVFAEHGRPGISCARALQGNIATSMADGGVRTVWPNNGVKIIIHIMWPGYEPWSQQLQVFRANTGYITKAELAHRIAGFVRDCLADRAQVAPNPKEAGARNWDARGFNPQNIYLLELRHVSSASWQPVLYIPTS